MSADAFPPDHLMTLKDRSFIMFTDDEMIEFKKLAESLVNSIFLDNSKLDKVEGKAMELSMPPFRWPLTGNVYLMWERHGQESQFGILAADDSSGLIEVLRNAAANVRRRHAHNLECIEKILSIVESTLVSQ